jgi:hypothetical protein
MLDVAEPKRKRYGLAASSRLRGGAGLPRPLALAGRRRVVPLTMLVMPASGNTGLASGCLCSPRGSAGSSLVALRERFEQSIVRELVSKL